MDYVIGISWPRSGHHMLVRLLMHYFGPDFGYCEYHAGVPNLEGIASCCKQVPCQHRNVIAFSKNHDFDLSAPQIPGQKYLIQYRDFIPSTISNFELYVRGGGEDSESAFRFFASKSFDNYQRFIAKWVTSEFAQSQLILNYDQFLENPERELSWVVRLFQPDRAVDSDRVKAAVRQIDGEKIEQRKVQALQGVGVHPPRDITQFRYYRPVLFDTLRNLHLTRAQVETVFQSVLERTPQEHNMLNFQYFETPEQLQDHLKASPEYQSRLNARIASPPSLKSE